MRSIMSRTNEIKAAKAAATVVQGPVLQAAASPANHRFARRTNPGSAIPVAMLGAALALATQAGCGRLHCLFHDDAPSAGADLRSATEIDVLARYQHADQRQRAWPAHSVGWVRGSVVHGPLYYEDPFEDKCSGHADFRWGWEDYLALAYSPLRAALNTGALPVSMIVTPPWTPMESDGVLSRQIPGYEHDAIPAAQARETSSPDDAAAKGAAAG